MKKTSNERSQSETVWRECLLFFTCLMIAAASPAADLQVLKSGLGSGRIESTPAGIDCGVSCEASFADTDVVELTAIPDAGSLFVGWSVDDDADVTTTPDCSGAGVCTGLSMDVDRSVRPVFDLVPGTIPDLLRPLDGTTPLGYPPEVIDNYLTLNPGVTNAAQFINALPDEFKQNWILMSRSESLQTGTAKFPRILLASGDIKSVFTIGAVAHSGYPASHPDAIEYMQWDQEDNNFRFHEIVLTDIPPLDADGDGVGAIPFRGRGVHADEARCSRCHSARNILSPGAIPGTDDVVKFKYKPNWDTYDSWGGMLPFNRDRIYQGSVEAAAVRKIFNPWTWKDDSFMRSIIEQLRLQPPGTPATHRITRLQGGINDGHVKYRFDPDPPVPVEPPPPTDPAPTSVTYNFDRTNDAVGTDVHRNGEFVTLQNPQTMGGDEGRGVDFFDILSGQLGHFNGLRIADELIDHTYATGSHPIDIRPIAVAISRNDACISINSATNTVESKTGTDPLNAAALSFLNARHGMGINDLVEDTRERAESLPIRKADIQKRNLDRTNDIYLDVLDTPTNGLIEEYGIATSQGTTTSKERLRQEVFRRAPSASQQDSTIMGGKYIDREIYGSRIDRTALYRYFLEPLGVSVDKWSTSVRGRSRTYTFADLFDGLNGTLNAIKDELIDSFATKPFPGLADPNDCADLIEAINDSFTMLPLDADEIPKYTDVQRVLNKSCIDCHGDLDYPPYSNYGNFLNFAENEMPPAGEDRLDRAHAMADSLGSFLLQRITGNYTLVDSIDNEMSLPYGPSIDETCPNFSNLMPCEGPPISQADIQTVRRWIDGGSPNSRGDPHLRTVNGVHYDFQAAGEYVLLKGQGLELQMRQTGVATNSPLGPNNHTGLTSCVSVNTAAALQIGSNRITYQPNLNKDGTLQLRVNGELTRPGDSGVALEGGGRIVSTDTQGGVRVEMSGGGSISLTPNYWSHYQVWYLHLDARGLRASDGLMGTIPSGQWLPALPDGTWLGSRPDSLEQRYKTLYGVLGNQWQVRDDTTLFDYAEGENAEFFQFEAWPNGESPQTCEIPTQPGIASVPAPAGQSRAEAEQTCADVMQPDNKENCIQDVMATGADEFASSYELSEAIELNIDPPVTTLITPADSLEPISLPINFEWSTVDDVDKDKVNYKLCIWETGTLPNNNDCELVGSTGGQDQSGDCIVWIILIIVLILLIVYLLKRKSSLLLILLAVIGLILAIYCYRMCAVKEPTLAMNSTVTVLKPGTGYYWRIDTEDGLGGFSSSSTRHFKTQ